MKSVGFWDRPAASQAKSEKTREAVTFHSMLMLVSEKGKEAKLNSHFSRSRRWKTGAESNTMDKV